MPRKKIGKYVFYLPNIDIETVCKTYGITITSNLEDIEIPPIQTTKISELSIDSDIGIISFLDPVKRLHKCQVSMVNYRTGQLLSNSYNCFWCKHPFENMPIGCPIRYVPSRIVKKYFSEITKDRYEIRENITVSKRKEFETLAKKDRRLTLELNEYYDTDGVFCSFNCCKAYILAHKHDPLYNDSNSLLIKMYNEIFGQSINNIDSAPSWRLLSEYGGNMDIVKFRSSFNKIDYEHFGSVKMYPLGALYEEKLKF